MTALKKEQRNNDYMKIENKYQLIGYLIKYHWMKVLVVGTAIVMTYKTIDGKTLTKILSLVGF